MSEARPNGPAVTAHPEMQPVRLSAAQKVLLAAEIAGAYAFVRRARQADISTVVATLRTAPVRIPPRVLADPVRDGLRLGNAVVRALAPSAAASKCLMRSLVLLRLLVRRGGDGALVIAVLPAGLSPLDAHAWIEVQGDPLLVPAPGFGRLITL